MGVTGTTKRYSHAGKKSRLDIRREKVVHYNGLLSVRVNLDCFAASLRIKAL